MKTKFDTTNLKIGYYQINNTKKVLYWSGEKWQQPVKDYYKRYTYISELRLQPSNVTTVTPIEETEMAWQYKSITDR
jgi:hypothetical protein